MESSPKVEEAMEDEDSPAQGRALVSKSPVECEVRSADMSRSEQRSRRDSTDGRLTEWTTVVADQHRRGRCRLPVPDRVELLVLDDQTQSSKAQHRSRHAVRGRAVR